MTFRRLSHILLLTLLAACSKNYAGYVPDDPLAFSAVASHSVKSIITTTNYPLDEPFVVEAVHYPDGQDKPGTLFMSREKIEYSFENAIWKPDNDYFWPEKGRLVFYAGSPIIPQLSVSPDHGVEAEWSVPSDGDTQTDLCFAEASEDCAKHSSAVPIVFNHALSQICFKARTQKNLSFSRTEDDMIQANVITVVLDSVKVRGLVSKGHFTQEPAGWTLDPSETAEYVVFRSDEGLELHTDRYETPILYPLSTMLLIPQELSAAAELEEWHHFKVRTSITDATTKEIVSDMTYTVPGNSVTPLVHCCREWLMDYKHTFRITIGLEKTDLAAAVTVWTETKELIIGDE